MEDPFGTIRVDAGRGAVRFERTYDTSAEDLWTALTDPERLRRWFADVSGDLRVGGAFLIVFDHTDETQRTSGRVLECVAPTRLVVTWEFADEGESKMTVDLVERDGRTVLTFDHASLPLASAAGYGAGWQTYLEQLEAHVANRPSRGPDWGEREATLQPLYAAQLARLEEP
jgi:uncharacterized protein YndB with AHSA1/START domain